MEDINQDIYTSFGSNRGLVLLDKLDELESIIFDFDGTIVDVINSYNQAILNTVKIIFGRATGKIPPDDIIKRAIFTLRSSGGFNNDWDASYTIIMGLFAGLPEDALKTIAGDMGAINRDIRSVAARTNMESCISSLTYILKYADERGVKSIDEGFESLYRKKDKLNYLNELKQKLGYPGGPDKSILSALFEEIFLGKELFLKVYNREPRLHLSRGLIDEEMVIPDKEAISYIKRKFNGKIGVASGRPRVAAERTSGDMMHQFINEKGAIFLDDIVAEYSRRLKESSTAKWPGKPEPFSLIRSMEKLGVTSSYYVGDSYEDLLMAQKARDNGYSVNFIAVYGSSLDPQRTMKLFTEKRANAIIPTVNELKYII
ncbi:MAG: HAD hydrolase-like protein [Nitrososphaerota archaeon]|jgi:phosphoglycolate phosphatase-like HAD superfamily hydrolase|nr:HAD hydrolase-like protein [Nitrososphaerota archaeon]MDG7042115.1 HAD hydrolase-like protein [Nitrososphaerota archaeon]MDG7043661.1 HAD hydrolase-like protein [Nitrososphaerota archaeon]MDG7046625.1 HAD hydrolase-like protein [Nitrososphaerota archaeon]